MIFIDLDQEERRRLSSFMKKLGDDWALNKLENKLGATGPEYSTVMSCLRLLSKIEGNEEEKNTEGAA